MKNLNNDDNILNIPELSDADVERLSKDIPALDSKAVKRITESCIGKMGTAAAVSDGFSEEGTVSGTEKYPKRKSIIRIASTAAACLAACLGIAGIVLINRNLNRNPIDTDTTTTEGVVSEALIIENTTGSKNTEAPENPSETGASPSEGTNESTSATEADTVTVTVTTVVSSASSKATTQAAATTTEAATTTAAELSDKEFFEGLKGVWQNEGMANDMDYIVFDGTASYTLYSYFNGEHTVVGSGMARHIKGGDGDTFAFDFIDETFEFGMPFKEELVSVREVKHTGKSWRNPEWIEYKKMAFYRLTEDVVHPTAAPKVRNMQGVGLWVKTSGTHEIEYI